MKTLSKRATLTEQQRHRLGSGSFEWRQPEKQRSQRGGLFWTVFPRGAVQNGAQLDRIAARRDFVQRELATRPPSGKKRPEVRREVASKRSRGASGHFAPSAVAASAAVVAQPAAAIAVSATAVSVATTAATARWFVIIEASPPATLVVSLAQRPQLHGLIPRGDGDAHRPSGQSRGSALRACCAV